MTATAEPVELVEEDDRFAREAVKLRTRTSLPFDRIFQRLGAAVMGIGLLAIVAGWYGVAHTARAWRQTPYLVSGGLLGLALVFIGCFAYFAFWLTRLVEQSQRQTLLLERIEGALVGVRDDATLVVVEGTLHRSSCPLAARGDAVTYDGKAKITATCPVCEPSH